MVAYHGTLDAVIMSAVQVGENTVLVLQTPIMISAVAVGSERLSFARDGRGIPLESSKEHNREGREANVRGVSRQKLR